MASKSPTDRPPAFIHVDCDGLSAVRSSYGIRQTPDPAGDRFWLEGIPAALELFGDLGLPATLFVIGADLQIEAHQSLTRQALEAGHEIASHSMTHDLGLRRASDETVRDELVQSAQIIEQITGVPAAGFRAPGFSLHPAHLRLVRGAGYRHDSSLFPSPWGPAMRTARRLLGSGGAPYGRWRDGWRTRAPHVIETDNGPLMEVPVSLTPRLRLPAHASFALLRGDTAMRRTVDWHARRRLPFVWLIHLIDLCDASAADLPTPRWSRRLFSQPAQEKRARLRRMLGWISEQFDVQRTDQWAVSQLDRL